jgi:hypothetical protein
LVEWYDYYTIEPFGEERGDLRIGTLAALTYNINRGKNSKALGPIDFMPFAEKPEVEMDPVVVAENWKRVKAAIKAKGPTKGHRTTRRQRKGEPNALS